MKNMKMQCVELCDDMENSIHCPFCGTKIAVGANGDDADRWIVGDCDHLLFAAIDETGFEFQSKRFEDRLEAAISTKTDAEREDLLVGDVRELTELVEIPNAFMFQSIMGHPAEQSVYIGFAPVVNEDKLDDR